MFVRIRLWHSIALALLCFVLAFLTACAGKRPPDTSQLSPEGRQSYTTLQVVRVVNDVTTAAIAANQANQLTDTATAAVLTVNKQVLDVIAANPRGFKAQALVVFANARDALPADVQALIAAYLARVSAVLQEVQ